MKKEKVLIILSGLTGSGKTQTLNSVICKLMEVYPKANYEFVGETKTINCADTPIRGDRRVVFSNVGNSKKNVGIATAGDNGKEVKNAMDLFDKHHCDIVICATKVVISTEKGSLSAMQQEIIKRMHDTQIIPLFKIMFIREKAQHQSYVGNDEFIKDVILNQLVTFI